MRLSEITANIEILAAQIEQHLVEVEARGDTTEILITYHKLKGDYEALDKARKMIFHHNDKMDKGTVPALFDRIGQDLVRIPDIGRSFYPVTKQSASIVGPKPDAYEWLRSNGGSEIIQETVNAGTLASFLKEMIQDQNIEPPPELILYKTYKTTGSSKYTPKG